jgi:hypothetical protein
VRAACTAMSKLTSSTLAFRDGLLAISVIMSRMIRMAGSTAVLELPDYSRATP